MDPNYNKPSTPSRRSKKSESEFLEGEDCRTAVETESLTDASIPREPRPASQQSARDAWAKVAPTTQPRIVPATRLSQADREAHEIASSTQRALETLRNSSDPRNRLFVSPAASQTTPKRATSPFRAFSGQGRAISSGGSPFSPAAGVRTAVAASPAQSSIRTAAARSPDVRTGVEHSGRSARLRDLQQSRSRSEVRTARSGASTPKKSRNRSKSGCSTVHTAAANYEIDLRQRTNSMTGPTSNASTARTISPVASSRTRTARSPARRPAVSPNRQLPYYNPDYPPLPSEGDPTEQKVELFDSSRLSQEYTPHVSRPILFGTGVSGVRTARAHSPARTGTLSERTAHGDTSIKTSRSPASKSEKSVRTARSVARKPSEVGSLGSYNSTNSKKEEKILSKLSSTRSHKSKKTKSKSRAKSQSQSSLATTSARSFATNKTWATDKSKSRKNKRSAHKSVSETPAGMRTIDASSKSGASRHSGRSGRSKKAVKKAVSKKAVTPLRTAAALSSARSPTATTAVSPDATSSKRSPQRASYATVRPITPDTPKGWPYRASQQAEMRQTSIRVAPSSSNIKTAKPGTSSRKSSKSPAQRSQKELHREAKSASSTSRRSQRSRNPTSNVSTAQSIAPRVPIKISSTRASEKSSKSLHSSKTNARTFSASTLRSAKRNPVAAIDNSPDMVIETVQAHGNIQIDLCFNFRVRASPGQGFGESRSPLKPKEVLINGQPIWKKE